MRPVKLPHCSEDDGKKRNALHKRWLTKSSLGLRHGLATFLTVMTA
jgi:hypothetical protein